MSEEIVDIEEVIKLIADSLRDLSGWELAEFWNTHFSADVRYEYLEDGAFRKIGRNSNET